MIRGDLTPKCATAVRAVFEALGTGKQAGPQDDWTERRRFHDALQLACVLLPRVCCSWTGRCRPVVRAFVCHMDLYGMVRIPWRYKDGV